MVHTYNSDSFHSNIYYLLLHTTKPHISLLSTQNHKISLTAHPSTPALPAPPNVAPFHQKGCLTMMEVKILHLKVKIYTGWWCMVLVIHRRRTIATIVDRKLTWNTILSSSGALAKAIRSPNSIREVR